MLKTLLTIMLALQIGCASAFEAYVVGVSDGDTITALTPEKQQIKVRLKGIDAPEKAQAFGQKSKSSLSDMVFNQQVELRCGKNDKYGRSVCYVFKDGVDLGLEQVKRGFAWWYTAYAKEQQQDQRDAYEQAEIEAKQQRLGLWGDADPVPPWEYRHTDRSVGR